MNDNLPKAMKYELAESEVQRFERAWACCQGGLEKHLKIRFFKPLY